jgi:tetrapyrrole methylase family protein/MazG family protein
MPPHPRHRVTHAEKDAMLLRIVGVGPGDPALVTFGALDALRSVTRAVTVGAPPALTAFLREHGVPLEDGLIADAGLFIRGGSDEIEGFVARAFPPQHAASDLAVGVPGNPLSDFPGLPLLLRSTHARGIVTEIVPGMPRAALSAALSMPLVPLPPQSSHHSFDDLVEIMARLRRGCPWDREQTHRTLIPYLIEETYEVVEAIEGGKLDDLCEELGDLLLQIVFHAQIASESGRFTVADVIDALSNKMVRRHPHVFGDAVIEDVDAQWRSWERLKALEKAGRARKSRLDGIPKHLGALQRGQRMQEKAARVGFDWPAVEGILDKLVEELRELAQARTEKNDDPHVREELGDVFFTLVNLARALGIDAESAMRDANEKFYRRFSYMEERAAAQGKTLADLSLEELDDLWQRAKTGAA